MIIPKFHVGEPVLLQSVSSPECNGEYIVEKILRSGDKYKCRLTENIVNVGRVYSYGYLLNTPHPDDKDCCEIFWAEKALRKKYPPSEFTFGELMDSLNKSNEGVK